MLNLLFRAYSLIIKRIIRSAIIFEINTKDVKLVKTNISSLHSKRHCQCLLECKDEILVFTNFTYLVLISTMIALLVILFIIKILLYQSLAFTIHGKILKSHTKIKNVKYWLQHGSNSLNYLVNHIPY